MVQAQASGGFAFLFLEHTPPLSVWYVMTSFSGSIYFVFLLDRIRNFKMVANMDERVENVGYESRPR